MPFALSLSKGPPPPTAPRVRSTPPTVVPGHSCEGRSRGAGCGNPTQPRLVCKRPRSPHRRSRESGNPGQGRGAGPPPPLELPPHPPPSYRRKPVSRGAPGGGTFAPPTHIAGALRDSVRPEPVEGPSATTSPRASRTPPPPSFPKAGTQGRGPRGRLRLASFLRRQESRGAGCGNPTQHLQAAPLPPPSFSRKREPRAGARRGAVSGSRTSHTRHRRTGESRYPEVRRAAARPHQPTSQARFEIPFALSLSKGPPPPTAPRAHTPATVVLGNPGQGRGAGPSPSVPPFAGTQGRGAAHGARGAPVSNPALQKHPDTTPLPARRPLPYPPPMHHARKHTGHKPTTPRMPRQPAQNASENTQNPLVSDQTSRICRGQFCRRLVSHIAKSPLKQFESSTAEEPPGGRPSPRDAICNKPETNTLRRRATLNAT